MSSQIASKPSLGRSTNPGMAPAALAVFSESLACYIAVTIAAEPGWLGSKDSHVYLDLAAREFIARHAPAILKHLVPPLHEIATGEYASAVIENPAGVALRLVASEGLQTWWLERADGSGIEAAGTSAFALVEFLMPSTPAGTPWLQMIGLASLLAVEEFAESLAAQDLAPAEGCA